MTPERILKRLQEALTKAPDYTVADIEKLLETGGAKLWIEGESIMVTEFVISPRLVSLHVFLAAGSWNDLARLKPIVEDWAKQQGCDMVGLTGRPGWGRRLPDYAPPVDTFVRML